MAAPLRIGLTGGIGSGKSTVGRRLVALGAALVDTDAISRALTRPAGAAMAAVAQTFGPEFVAADGGLDRDRMRTLAFQDSSARRRLEAILHPLIGEQAQREADAAALARAIVFDVPLLVESGRWRDRVERVLVVDCNEATQVERVVARSGWSPEAVRGAMAQQASRARRRAAADAVIHNDDGLSLDALHRQVDTLWIRWTNRDAAGFATRVS